MRCLLLLCCLGACELDLERMIDQPYYRAYEACEVCPTGTIMMAPPEDTVARDEVGEPVAGDDSTYPVALDQTLLARGRNRFDIYCAACHGRIANGLSQVAENMTLRRPPNLLAPPYTTYSPRRLFVVITQGFGLMRSYAAELPVRDRWAVVAYLQALQLSQSVVLRELPDPIQTEARSWLK
jgi:mono/diheme cytochrome c family protein